MSPALVARRQEKGFSTRAVHVGSDPDEATNAVIQPISLSTTFKQDAVGVHKPACSVLGARLLSTLELLLRFASSIQPYHSFCNIPSLPPRPMSWFAQDSFQRIAFLDTEGGLHATSSKIGTRYPPPQPSSSGHHRGPNIEHPTEGWGSPPEGPRPVTASSSANEPPNGRIGHHNAVDTRKGRSSGRFPHRLRCLMGTPDAAGLIGWNDKGNALIVRDHKALETASILSQHFNHNSWDAVVRQLHYYGFEKANRAQGGEKHHVYRHRHFLREHPELLDKMKPVSQGRESAKDFASRVRSEMEDMNKRLARAEESIEVLKKEKKALEDENKKLKKENSILQFLNSLLEPLHRVTSTMWTTQPPRNEHCHAGSSVHNVSSDPQPLMHPIQNTPHPSESTYEFSLGQPPLEERSFPNVPYKQPVDNKASGSLWWSSQPSVPAVSAIPEEGNYPYGSSVTGHLIQPANPTRTIHRNRTVEYVPVLHQGAGGYQM